jgi:hypothetical protein
LRCCWCASSCTTDREFNRALICVCRGANSRGNVVLGRVGGGGAVARTLVRCQNRIDEDVRGIRDLSRGLRRKVQQPNPRGTDVDDVAGVDSVNQSWMTKASRGQYQALAHFGAPFAGRCVRALGHDMNRAGSLASNCFAKSHRMHVFAPPQSARREDEIRIGRRSTRWLFQSDLLISEINRSVGQAEKAPAITMPGCEGSPRRLLLGQKKRRVGRRCAIRASYSTICSPAGRGSGRAEATEAVGGRRPSTLGPRNRRLKVRHAPGGRPAGRQAGGGRPLTPD